MVLDRKPLFRSRRAGCTAVISVFAWLAGPGTQAAGQLVPERTYYGRYRPMPMSVRIPPDAPGEATLRLYEAGASQPVSTATVAPGTVNLAAVFSSLWRDKDATLPPPVLLYAQLAVGDKRIGPAVVLQPMIDPAYAPLIEPDGKPSYRPSRGIYSGIRAYVEKDVVMETSLGDVVLALRPDAAPNTSWHFMQLVSGGFYTDVLFHRVKPKHPNGAPFVVQAGDPLQRAEGGGAGAGEGGPGFTVNLEPSTLPHDFGVVAMSRMNLPNSAGSQFYIALSRKGTEYLDGKYTTFAQVVSGGAVLEKIAASEVVPGTDKPKDPPVIKKCRLVDAPPRGDGPREVAKPSKPEEVTR